MDRSHGHRVITMQPRRLDQVGKGQSYIILDQGIPFVPEFSSVFFSQHLLALRARIRSSVGNAILCWTAVLGSKFQSQEAVISWFISIPTNSIDSLIPSFILSILYQPQSCVCLGFGLNTDPYVRFLDPTGSCERCFSFLHGQPCILLSKTDKLLGK